MDQSTVLSTNGTGATGYYTQKGKFRSLSHAIHKNLIYTHLALLYLLSK